MLEHRGPDEHGYYRNPHIGLAHTRLSIIDIDSGQQPMSWADGRLWISFNGEIFNHLELRAELEKKGAQFRTHSDTEVILACYQQYGDLAWEKLNGQFSIALVDQKTQQLHLVRDRLGILPLHYCQSDDGRFLFASEIKSLLTDPEVRSGISSQGLSELLCFWSSQSPQTMFRKIYSVKPATCLTIDYTLSCKERTYWRADFTSSEALKKLSDDELSEALEEKLSRAVSLRLRSDVPVGSYLSGGLDSSVICHSIKRQHDGDLATYAIGFSDKRFDETAQQQTMSAFLGTQHHSLNCDSKDIATYLPEIIWHCETPLTRTSPVPLYMLSGLVRSKGMKVVMTGEGADELLAGYNIFKEDKIRRFWAKQPDSKIRPRLLGKLYPYIDKTRNNDAMWISFFAKGFQETSAKAYSHRLRWGNGSWAWRFVHPDLRQQWSLESSIERISASLPNTEDLHPQSLAQQTEINTFMSNYLLPFQGDRVAMGHSIEVRYPFLDPDVVDFCLKIPPAKTLSGLRDKLPLRKIGSRHLPTEIWQRPKQPYRAPVTSPLFGSDKPDYVEEMLDPSIIRDSGLWDESSVRLLANKARKKQGNMNGEREEMAMLAVLTTQLLQQSMFKEFSDRLQNNLYLLRSKPCLIKVDHC